MPPRLTVIVPFYDETAFLPMALNSIAAQGLAGVEVLVVNDNPDRFGAADFAAMPLPAGVRLVHHDRNRGLSAARNSGMAQSEGRIVGFLDADDYYLTGGLAAQLAAAEAEGADITHANAMLSALGTPALRPLPRDAALFDRRRRGPGLAAVEEAQFITSSWSSLYRRDFLHRAGLAFDPAQVKFEDRLFVLQAVTAARSILCTGQAARVWRRRGGSISVAPAEAGTLRLQLQLLEKCMALMRAHAARAGVPPRFLKRELFNTVARLIWDTGLIEAAARGDPGCEGFAGRIAALLGEDRFGAAIFDDPVLARISRVGLATRRGLVRRQDFLALHKALREGDPAAAAALLAARRPVPPAPAVRRRRGVSLVLHLGMHKTGSTWLQRALIDRRAPLLAAGVLVPRAGLAAAFAAVRPGGFPGHLALLAAARHGDPAPWDALEREIADSGCRTVVLSCENMLMPTSADREEVLPRLLARLGGFDAVRLVAFVRRPDRGPEMFYRELVCNGQRGGARSAAEFLVDHGAALTDLPLLFAPWERQSGAPVALVDHDRAAAEGAHWPRFLAAAGIAAGAAGAPPQGRAYPSATREQVEAARLVNAMVADEGQRIAVLQAFFAAAPPAGEDAPLLPPAQRLALIDLFDAQSACFAAARGYAPDLEALRAAVAAEAWAPPPGLSAATMERLAMARLQAEVPGALRTERLANGVADGAPPDALLTLRLRPRPWLRRSLVWAAARMRH
jgi:hypothetical protein